MSIPRLFELTVVVGPNGSGKSNVVDAVAWVLGAQGPRVVRSAKMDDVIFVGRPAFGQEHSSSEIFRLDADGVYANRTPVQFGRSSVSTIEIVKGLEPGDKVILSDMSQWDSHDRIKLN